MRIVIYPYNRLSKGARNLRDAFKAEGHRSLVVSATGNYEPRRTDIILGWGNSTVPEWNRRGLVNQFMNNPQLIPTAVNKLQAFKCFVDNGIATLPFTRSEADARDWLRRGKRVIGRARVAGSQGEGIHVIDKVEDLIPLPLYTKFIKSDREYRVYVFKGRVIDVLQKRRPNGAGNIGPIRSANNGWVFCRTNIRPLPDAAAQECIKAVNALGLDFGGVDVLWGNKRGAKVLEVNTSPGIEGEGVRIIARGILQGLGV